MESTRDFLPVIRPTLPSLDELAKCIATSWASGVVTVGSVVREFEAGWREREFPFTRWDGGGRIYPR
jgi:hypothetical protein